MADYSWLDAIGDDGWRQAKEGMILDIAFEDFAARSDLVPNAAVDWRVEFDAWGATRPRNYSQFVRPPLLGKASLMITALPGMVGGNEAS